MKLKALMPCIFVVAFPTFVHASSAAPWKCMNHDHGSRAILPEQYTHTPLYTKPDGRPSTTAGVIIAEDGYILLARERKSGDFSEFSGRGEINESLLSTAKRELEEETGAECGLSEDISNVYASCYQHQEGKREVLILMAGNKYKDPDLLKRAADDYARKKGDEPDKVEFLWVKISFLPKRGFEPGKQYTVTNRDGAEINIAFRPYFIDYLKSHVFQETLRRVDVSEKGNKISR